MNGLPYYKAYPRDFVEGTIGMPFDLKAAYRLALDLIYMQGGKLPDDSRYIAGLLGCSTKAWNGYRAKLLEMGKLYVLEGSLRNYRADKELETLAKLSQVQGEKRRGKSKNNDLPEPQINHTEPEPDTEVREESPSEPLVAEAVERPPPQPPPVPAKKGDGEALDHALALYAEAAERQGWPQVAKFTTARRAALRARLKDVGGIEGWQDALAKAEASDFLCGRARKVFMADFNFLTRESAFVSLMEGKYDNRTPQLTLIPGALDGQSSRAQQREDDLRDLILAAARS